MVGGTALSGAPGFAGRFLPLQAGEPCGDGGLRLATAAGELLALVDGLGHGAPAAQATEAALALLAAHGDEPLPQLLQRLDRGLAATRGAAVGLARLQGTRLHYVGIGNTRAMRWRDGAMARLSSQYGIVGAGLPAPPVEMVLDLRAGDWLLMSSDGLDEMLRLPAMLPEWLRDPGLLCEHLLARWRNPRDDAGVLVRHWTTG